MNRSVDTILYLHDLEDYEEKAQALSLVFMVTGAPRPMNFKVHMKS